MTMKEIFKKVETYNEVAEMMGTTKASIYFADIQGTWSHGEHFKTYADFRKYIKDEYIKEVANIIIKADTFEMDKETTLTYTGRFNEELTATYSVELSAN